MSYARMVGESHSLSRPSALYYYYYYYYYCPCHCPFPPGTPLGPTAIPTVQAMLRFDSNTFRVSCDVPSIAIFCSESAELLSSQGFVFFFKTFGTIHVFPSVYSYHHTFHIPHSLHFYTWTPAF